MRAPDLAEPYPTLLPTAPGVTSSPAPTGHHPVPREHGRRAHLTAEPLTDGQARSHAAAGGVLVAAGAGGITLAAVSVARFHLSQRRMEQWAVEWERIDTQWGRKAG
jgi:hypothetical protein